MRFIHPFLFTMISLTTWSCGTAPVSDQKGAESSPTTQAASPITPAFLRGAWDSSCRLSSINTPFYERTSVIFAGGQMFTQERRLFVDNKCQKSAAISTASGTYELTASTTPAITSITYRVSYVLLETISDAGAAAFNAAKGCGYTDWRINLAHNVTGKECWGYTVSKHDLWKDIVSFQDPKLFFGKRAIDSQGRYTFGERPTELSSSDPFLRR